MNSIHLTIPYPPSVNKIYYNRSSGMNGRGRGLTKEAKNYKLLVANLIHYTFPTVKFGHHFVKLIIIDHSIRKNRDNHNGIKILCDAIELSGAIDNDKNIISLEMISPIHCDDRGWEIILKHHSLTEMQEDLDRINIWKAEFGWEEDDS